MSREWSTLVIPGMVVHCICSGPVGDLYRLSNSCGKHMSSSSTAWESNPPNVAGGARREMVVASMGAEGIEGLAVCSVGYEAPVLRLTGAATHRGDRAENIAGRRLFRSEIGTGRITPLGRSLGGW
jgi:hypothetical protein